MANCDLIYSCKKGHSSYLNKTTVSYILLFSDMFVICHVYALYIIYILYVLNIIYIYIYIDR